MIQRRRAIRIVKAYCTVSKDTALSHPVLHAGESGRENLPSSATNTRQRGNNFESGHDANAPPSAATSPTRIEAEAGKCLHCEASHYSGPHTVGIMDGPRD